MECSFKFGQSEPTRSQKFIEKYRRILDSGPEFYNPDTEMMSVEDYNNSDLKVLIVFPSPVEVKDVSSTKPAMNDIVKSICNQSRTEEQNAIPWKKGFPKSPNKDHARGPLNVFIDFAFMPGQSDIKLYDKHRIPYAIGQITHLDASHFDVVGFSISVLSDNLGAPQIITTFKNCDTPIYPTWTERKDLTLTKTPLIFAGGITCAVGDIMFGDLQDGTNRQSFMDFSYLGAGEKLDLVFERLINSKSMQVQEFIDTLFDLYFIYQPQAYRVTFNDKNQITENIKINPKAQDFVSPYYPFELDPAPGIARTIINGRGGNTGTAQSQVSEGCSCAGACSFCSEGNYTSGWVEKTKEQILSDCRDAKKFGFCYKYKPYSFNMLLSDTWIPTPDGYTTVAELKSNDRVYTPNGIGLVGRTLHTVKDKYLEFELTRGVPARMSVEHKQMVLTSDGLIWKKADEIKVGDWIPQSVGYLPVDNYEFSVEGYVLGLWFGDGNRRGGEEWTGNMLNFNLDEVELIDFCKKLGIIRTVTPRTDANVGVATIVSHGDLIKRTFPNYKYDEHNLDKLSLNEILSFIRGWFDSDGCTSYNQSQSDPTRSCRIHVAFSTKSMKVARFVGMVLQSVGINFHISKPVKATLNGKEFSRRDLVITGRRSRELFVNLIGFTETSKLSKISVEKTKWSDKDKTLPGIFGVWVKRSLGDNCHGFNVSKFFQGIKGLTEDRFQSLFESVDVEPVKLFKNGMRFSQVTAINLHEEQVECVDIEETTVHQYLTEFGYTHNCNYLTDYKGMLGEFMKIFPKVTFINMRMEELGRDVDAMRIMKLIGSNRISFPLEGLSPRIQNNLLNKCLSEESLTNALGWCVHGGMADIKVGGIFTGYEEQEDIDWICNLVDKFKVQAKREDGTFNFRLKCTPLVHYPLTPLEYLERKSTRKSYEGEHWLTDEWYEQFKAHDVFFKVNGFRFSTFMEQTIVDLGRAATGWLWKILQSESKIYSLRSVASEENIKALKALVNPDYFFNDRDPEHYISICHRIHIDLMGSYIPRARKLLRCKKEGDVFKNVPDIRCLKTFEGAKTKCYKMCVSKDPLKIYNDVTMDEDGNLHGDFRELKGCERCPDNEHRAARLNREYKASLDSNGIMAIPRIKKVQKIRFILSRNAEYDVLNPNNTAHTFGSRILQSDESLVDSFRELTRHSMFWQADPDMPYMCTGYQVVDTVWSSKVLEKVKLAALQANKTLKSVEIAKVIEEFIDEDIRVDDLNIFRFESDLPLELFEASALSYKGEVKVKKDVNSEIIQDTTLIPPVFRTKGKTIGYFACPTRYNPYYYLQGFFNAKKVTTNTLVETTKLHCSMVVRESMSICKCGKEKTVTSLITGKSLPFGKQCLIKALLLREFK